MDSVSSRLTFQMMECGYLDLTFDKLIQKGIVLIGNTKAGKTTTFHYMMNSVLEGAVNQQGRNIYILKQSHKQIGEAIIGIKPRQSQTQIPNISNVNINGMQITLIDFPGFNDSYGFFRSMSNSYFIKKVFQQVKNIKFILVASATHLDDVAASFKNMLQSFFKVFKEPAKAVKMIIQSVGLLITRCPTNMDYVRLEKMLNGVASSVLKGYYKDLLQEIINKKSFFMIKQAVVGKKSDNDKKNELITNINTKVSKWWQRDLEKQQNTKVDMSHFRINLTDAFNISTSSQLFQSQFEQFANFLKSMGKNFQNNNGKQDFQIFISSFVDFLASDKKQAHDNLKLIVQKLVTQIERKKVANTQQEYLAKKYSNKWDKLNKKIYNQSQSSSNSIFANIPINQIQLIKIKGYKKILEIGNKSMLCYQNQKIIMKNNVQAVQKILQICVSSANKLKLQFKDKIIKLAFFLHIKAVLSLDIYEIISKTSQQMKKYKHNMQKDQLFKYICTQFPIQLKQSFSVNIQLWPHLIQYIRQFNPKTQVKTPEVYRKIYQFINEIEDNIRKMEQQDKKQYKLNQNEEQLYRQLAFKKLYLRYKEIESNVQNLQTQKQKQHELLKQINKQIENIQKLLPKEQQNKNNSYQELLALQNQYIYIMAYLYIKNNDIDQALLLYESINDAYKVLQIYEDRENQLQKNMKVRIVKSTQRQKMLNWLIGYMYKAYQYQQNELAIKKAQKAYSFAKSLGDLQKLKQIGKFICKISPNFYEQAPDEDTKIQEIASKRINFFQRMGIWIDKPEITSFINKQMKINTNMNMNEQRRRYSLQKKQSLQSPKNHTDTLFKSPKVQQKK